METGLAIAQSIAGAVPSRIQCTPDLQPADVTGSAVYDQRAREFEFRPGPIFANVVLLDEVNRATQKTQSALLEAMAERQVTVDGVTRGLASPFLLLATENPIEQEGTFPLPEAQLDRFLLRFKVGVIPVIVAYALFSERVMFWSKLDILALSFDDGATPTELVTQVLIELGDWFQTLSKPAQSMPYYVEAAALLDGLAAAESLLVHPLRERARDRGEQLDCCG
jgi:hypothetical protein